MEPDAKKPMAIAAIAVLLVVVVFLKGFTPLLRFQVIQALIARLRAAQRTHSAASTNGPTTAPVSFRDNRLVVAIFGPRVATSTVDLEQAGAAPPPNRFDPSTSTPSLDYPPPAYTRYHTDERYNGPVAYNRPSANATPSRIRPTPSAPHPPAYASSPSLPVAQSTPIATS